MQPDEFRFLGSLNYCLNKMFTILFYYYVNFNLFKCHSPVNACTTETEITVYKVLNMDIFLAQTHRFNSEGLY